MNRLPRAKRVAVIAALVEGNSIRSTARMTDVSKPTILKFLQEFGAVCVKLHDEKVRGIAAKRIQLDEIWSYIGAKERAIKKDPTIKERNRDAGDSWTWLAIDSDSKLIISYLIGPRRPPMAYHIVEDLRARVSTLAPQISTDALPWYAHAIDRYFGIDVEYGTIQKIFAAEPSGKYSPPICIGCKKRVITGDPDPDKISTSHMERQNLTLRMQVRRFTRLTNAFSRKLENHAAAVAIHYAHYNFVRIHQTLRVTPAMQAGITDRVWNIGNLVDLLEQTERMALAS